MVNLHDAMLAPELFGKTFARPTFKAWRTVAKALDALPLDAEELALYQQMTGRTVAPTEPVREAYLVKPRRSGGTLFLAAQGVHAAIQDYRPLLGPGEVATVACVASDRRQARQLMNYAKGLIADSPIIAAEVVAETKESMTFAHRVNLEVHVGSFRSTRGYSYACVLLDELAFYRSDDSASPDVELVRAVRPGLTNLRGRLLGSSSPHARRGHLWEMHRAHYGRDGDRVLVLQAGGPLLNPTIDQELVAQARQEDPVAARSEWDAEFRGDIAQFLDEELIERAIVSGRRELPFRPHTAYTAFVDPSGGRHDAFTCAIAHRDQSDKIVLDRLLVQAPPFDPDEATGRFCETVRAFGLHSVTGDRYAAIWVEKAFAKHGVKYEHSGDDKSALYLNALPLFSQDRLELLDVPLLGVQLRMLERRPRGNGRPDLVDHAPRSSDDAANAALGAAVLASRLSAARVSRAGRDRPLYAVV